MRTCSSAVMSWDTTKTCRMASGTSVMSWQLPTALTSSLMRSRVALSSPARSSAASNSGLV